MSRARPPHAARWSPQPAPGCMRSVLGPEATDGRPALPVGMGLPCASGTMCPRRGSARNGPRRHALAPPKVPQSGSSQVPSRERLLTFRALMHVLSREKFTRCGQCLIADRSSRFVPVAESVVLLALHTPSPGGSSSQCADAHMPPCRMSSSPAAFQQHRTIISRRPERIRPPFEFWHTSTHPPDSSRV